MDNKEREESGDIAWQPQSDGLSLRFEREIWERGVTCVGRGRMSVLLLHCCQEIIY